MQLPNGWGDGTTANVRDLWLHADMGRVIGSIYNTTVDPHGTILYRLTPS
jgi:hypothetical protein